MSVSLTRFLEGVSPRITRMGRGRICFSNRVFETQTHAAGKAHIPPKESTVVAKFDSWLGRMLESENG